MWSWFMVPTIINAEPLGEAINSQVVEQLVEPVKTYYLTVLGEGRGELNIEPPATKIVVTSLSGDTTIRCGDEKNVYSCSPGRRLELEYEVATPVVKFWGENLSNTQVRVRIDVYEVVLMEDDSPES